jgi:hypothetical protein
LAIHFHDGKPDDIALLKRINPIPKGVNEDEDSIDKCIFSGKLLLEKDVQVTMTGGCPFEDSFEVLFHNFFKIVSFLSKLSTLLRLSSYITTPLFPFRHYYSHLF